jgi:hypothetical protein
MIISCDLSKAQQAKLKKIVKSGNPDKVRLTKEQLESNKGQHFIKLNMEQTKQAMSALNRKKGMDLMLTKQQLLDMNQEQAGGWFFLPMLIGAAEAAAPYVASAVATWGAEKAVSAIGNALFGNGVQGGDGLALYKKPQEGAGMKKKTSKKKR